MNEVPREGLTEIVQRIARATGVSAVSVAKILEEVTSLEDSGTLDLSEYLTYGDLLKATIRALKADRIRYQAEDLSAIVPPEFPGHVQVQTIGGCNAACPMCAMSSPLIRQSQKGKMPLDLFIKIIDECSAQEHCQEIALYLQNEPLLDPELALKVRLTKDRSRQRLSTRIVTNGYLLDPNRIEELLDAGIDVISISLNAFTAQTYAKVMPGLEFARTLKNVEHLLERKGPELMVTLTFMVTAANEHEIKEAIAYWSQRGVLCGAYGIGTMSGAVPNFVSIRAKSAPAVQQKECYMPLESISILTNGDVLLCCTDWARESISGNISHQSLHDIWHSESVATFRREAILDKFEHKICKKCLGQTRVPANLMFEGGPGAKYPA